MTKLWVIVPVKCLSQVKQRLSPVLNQSERSSLVLAMLHDVLNALRTVEKIDGILVTSRSKRVLDFAHSLKVHTFAESSKNGMSSAITEAITHVETSFGATRVLILPADIPGITQEDVIHLQKHPESVVLVPDKHGTGTNAIVSNLPLALQLQFGESSLQKHQSSSEQKATLVHNKNIAMDIDMPTDLYTASQALPNCLTRQFLSKQNIATKIHQMAPL